MKKLYIIGATLLSLYASAQTLDSFTGTGALSANGWTTHSGTAGQLTILDTASDAGNSLWYTGAAESAGNRIATVAGNGEDANKAIAEPITGVVYYSVLLKVQNTTALNENTATGDYFFGVTSAASASTTAFQGRLYIKKGTAENTFNLGVLNNSGGAAAPSYVSVDYAVNTTYYVVLKYDVSANSANIWVNPALGGAETAADATNATGTTAAPTSIAGVFIRQGGSATAGTGNNELDEIRVGTTWESVTPAGTNSIGRNEIAGLKVFPNPLNGNVLNIASNNGDEKAVTIFDVLGKQVFAGNTANSTVNVNLTAGVYIVKITEEGKTATRKLVVK